MNRPGTGLNMEWIIPRTYVINDNTEGDKIEDLLEGKPLMLHLVVDAPQVFDPASNISLDIVFVQEPVENLEHLLDIGVVFFASLLDLLSQVFARFREKVLECEVFQFALDPGHPEAVRQGCVYIHGLLGHLGLFFRVQVLEGPHVMKPVGEFDHDDPDVLGH